MEPLDAGEVLIESYEETSNFSGMARRCERTAPAKPGVLQAADHCGEGRVTTTYGSVAPWELIAQAPLSTL
jgi:hypothetical protein